MAALTHMTIFTATGRGPFPSDMLRYDSCFPMDENEIHFLTTKLDAGTRTVRLATNHEGATHWLKPARWKSFGWTINILNTLKL